LITPTAGGFSAPSIFLPAAGHRNHDTGDIVGAGSAGRYWSSTPTTSGTKAVGYGIEFTSSAMGTGVTGWNRGRGFSIRCVHE